MQLTIPTTDDIRAAVRDELSVFFSLNQFKPQPEVNDIIGIDEAVQVVGKAKSTLYSLVHSRKIPHSKQGKQLYFSRKELTEWLKSGKRKTRDEIKLEAETFSSKKS